MAMQAVQPRVKELQAKYANEPETLQVETARLYKNAGINPLAGCLPTLATIPVFIGLYRALTKAADDGLLTSGFFWIPSLAGPSSLAARQAVGVGRGEQEQGSIRLLGLVGSAGEQKRAVGVLGLCDGLRRRWFECWGGGGGGAQICCKVAGGRECHGRQASRIHL